MSTFGRFGKMTTCLVLEKEAKSTNTIQEYNQNRSHGLETLFKFKKTQLEDHGRSDASWNWLKAEMEKNEQQKYYYRQETFNKDLCVSCFRWNVIRDETIVTKIRRRKERQLTKATWRANLKIVSYREDKQQRRQQIRFTDNIWRIDKWISITTKFFLLLLECRAWSRSVVTFSECSRNSLNI